MAGIRIIRGMLLGGVALAVQVAPAVAQTVPAETGGEGASRSADKLGDEIVVTAQRREERLIDVPISVSVLSTAEIEGRGSRNVSDLQYSVPNLTIYSPSNFSPNFIIRGIGSSARNIGFESGLGVYIDGVFTGRSETFSQNLEDIERLEVLRGPQGTLFGKNTTVGAINITTRRPGNETHGYAIAQYGNFDVYRFSGGLSGPLVNDRLAAKITGFAAGRDGYSRNISPTGPSRIDDDHNVGVRGELRWTPSAGWDIALRGDWSRSRQTTFEAEIERIPPDGNPFGVPENSFVPGPRTLNVNSAGLTRRRIYGGSLTIERALDSGLTFTSVTAQRNQRITIAGLDTDNTSYDYLRADISDQTQQFTQEVRLTSPSTGRLRYVLGAFYFQQRTRSQRAAIVGPDTVSVLTGFGIPADLFDPSAVTTRSRVRTSSIAGFANGSFELTGRLSLLAGARVTREEKRLRVAQQSPAFLALPGVLGDDPIYINIDPTRDRQAQTDFSPTAGLSYKINERANLYARYAKGFKSGGWNADLIPPNDVGGTFSVRNIRFKAESIANYEVGAKLELLERRLRLNLALYWLTYDNIQLSRFVGGLQGYATDNAGKARSRGFELEVAARPVESLELTANVGYADAEYIRYRNGCGAGCDLDGTSLDAPPWTAALSAQFTPRLSSNINGLLRIDYSYRSTSSGTGDPAERVLTSKPAYDLVNLRAGLVFGSGLELSVFARNPFNRSQVIDRIPIGNLALLGVTQQAAYYEEPRTYGVRLEYRF